MSRNQWILRQKRSRRGDSHERDEVSGIWELKKLLREITIYCSTAAYYVLLGPFSDNDDVTPHMVH